MKTSEHSDALMNRRDALKLTLAAAGSSLVAGNRVPAQSPELLNFLCPPDGVVRTWLLDRVRPQGLLWLR